MSNLILCFLEIPKIFICVRAFLLVSSLQFYTLEIRERKAYRKQMGSNVTVLLNKVSTLAHDRFKQVSLHTASWLFANT